MTAPASSAEWLRAAVERLGGQNATARLLGISQPSVWRWLRKGQHLPAEHVAAIATATGISRHDLRPDLFGAAPELLAGPAEYEHAR